jgi:molybdopterin synthase catalytic subunit
MPTLEIEDRCFLGRAPIDAAAGQAALEDPASGALVSFVGRVRQEHQGRAVLGLIYEAHEPMALKEMRKLLAAARGRWDLGPLLLAHRLGPLDIGEVAVLVAVCSAHRDEAFSACRFLIEGVKERVPIWKHEFYKDGKEAWVGVPGWNQAAKG